MENDKLNELEKKEENLDIARQNIQNKEKEVLKKEEKEIKLKEKTLGKENQALKDKEKQIIEKERVLNLGDEEKAIVERKEKLFKSIKNNPSLIFFGILILLVLLGFSIRYLPLSDHGGKPGLWDSTTNDYTLGPDLDPFLFLRYAKTIIENGSLAQMDNFRNVPLGFDTTTELQMVSYMIVLTYKLVNIFGNYSINYAGAFMPVIFFMLTIIAFFFFVREIFWRKEDKEKQLKANFIASIATLFMIIMPSFLSRTVAGIPEKESIGFFFMFLALFLFLRAWKTEKVFSSIILGILAGLSTGLMALSWGGVIYVYMTLGLVGLVAFILGKFGNKEILGYFSWLISSAIIQFAFTNRYSIKGFLFGIDTGLACLVILLFIGDKIIWNTKLKEILKLEKLKLPKVIISFLVIIIFGLLILLVVNPNYITQILNGIESNLIKPVTGRWSTTVAENRQPYFGEWFASFGKVIFWLFIIGSSWLFYKMFEKLKKKDKIILTGGYILFLLGLIFSRYAPHPALFDGENFISKFIYFGSALLLIGTIIYLYIKYHRENDLSFETVELEYILLFALFVITIASARGAVRLIMVLVPIAPIFVAYLITESGFKIFKTKESVKIFWICLFALLIIISGQTAYNYYKAIKSEAYNYVPYYYTLQWQEAMSWVRDNTPLTSVFAHWWDYGYWVQSIGNRATVTDGGNAITWWNYLTGRFVLTGDNQNDALELLWNHNATHLLIDSSDIGKYGAFSQIGSDINYDRLSAGPVTLFSDAKQAQETKNETKKTYSIPSGNGMVSLIQLEEDINIEVNDTKISLFKENTGLAGIQINYNQINDSIEVKQAQAIFVSQGKQVYAPLRYIKYGNQFTDLGSGLEATAYIIQNVNAVSSGLSIDSMGAMIYLSPRIMRGMLGQIYVLNDPLKKFPNFKLVHNEPDYIIKNLNSQNANLGEFVYYQGLRGPIKIWSIEYNGDEKYNKEYVQKEVPSSITWSF